MIKKNIRIAIIGTGGMAKAHVQAYQKIKGCQVVACCDVDEKRARTFADTFQIPHSFGSVEKLLSEGDFEAVSIVTPDGSHKNLSVLALKAGKHVLCEKPLALNAKDAAEMVRIAKQSGKINMVNFSYRNWSPIYAIKEQIDKGVLGDIRHVEASYLQAWLVSNAWGDWRTNPTWLWRLSQKHGSKGVLGDVGVHIFDFATFPVGGISSIDCRLKVFPKAKNNKIGEYTLDANDSAAAIVTFKNGAMGVIHTTRWCGGHANRLFLKISGSKGSVEFDSEVSTSSYRLSSGKNVNSGKWKTITVKPGPVIYERFVASIKKNKNDLPDFARGLEVQKMLDGCFESDKKNKTTVL
jgi:predicted dehydrogenase